MKIVVLSQGPNLYSTRRLVSVARRRGHSVEILNPLRLSIAIQDGEPVIFHKRREVATPDAVIPRIAASITEYGLAVLRQFEAMGAVPANSSSSIERARDKLRCLQILAAKGARMPDSAFACDGHGAVDALQPPITVRGASRRSEPLVVKRLKGTQGKGVMLAQDGDEARALLDAFHQTDDHALIQRFVSEAAGRDVRVFVVGGRVVACMERRAQDPSEFRSNLHLGGVARQIPLLPSVEKLSLRSTKALGLTVAGVDVLMSKRGPMVLEVNPSPGLEGIEGATNKNVAGSVIEELERLVAERRRRPKKGRGRTTPIRRVG